MRHGFRLGLARLPLRVLTIKCLLSLPSLRVFLFHKPDLTASSYLPYASKLSPTFSVHPLPDATMAPSTSKVATPKSKANGAGVKKPGRPKGKKAAARAKMEKMQAFCKSHSAEDMSNRVEARVLPLNSHGKTIDDIC